MLFSARHCCSFCTLSKQDMQKTPEEREPGILRSLDQINEHYALLQADGGKHSRAKIVSYNVIYTPLLNVPMNQVCIFQTYFNKFEDNILSYLTF